MEQVRDVGELGELQRLNDRVEHFRPVREIVLLRTGVRRFERSEHSEFFRDVNHPMAEGQNKVCKPVGRVTQIRSISDFVEGVTSDNGCMAWNA